MFTGLIEACGRVLRLEPRGENAVRLHLDIPFAPELVSGESVSVNGCCLTVTASGEAVAFDLLVETLHRTNLGSLQPGGRVNLERALRADGRFGGHFVQGHVDTTAEVLQVESKGGDLNVILEIPPGGDPYFIEKGSVAVNGVSLTVASLGEDHFGLWIIPHTLQETNLGDFKPGDRVNLEYDMLAKYAERQLGHRP